MRTYNSCILHKEDLLIGRLVSVAAAAQRIIQCSLSRAKNPSLSRNPLPKAEYDAETAARNTCDGFFFSFCFTGYPRCSF